MVRAKINGTEYKFEGAPSILEAARRAGVEIPTLCHDDRLKDVGACRLCLVDIKGQPKSVISCTTPLADGMEIDTQSQRVETARRWNLRMLARDYPREAFEKYPEKPFHKIARVHGLTSADFSAAETDHKDNSHVYIAADMSRCIDCYRCVRICAEVQGQFVWHKWGRGETTEIVPDSFGEFSSSTCVSCGACSDACPTGALEDKSVIERGFPTTWTRSTCPYCGTGCEIDIGTRNDKVVQIRPVMDAPVNKGHLCVKGRYAFDFIDAPDRTTEPMIREKGGEWRVVSWEEAIHFTAERMREIVDRDGNDAIAVLGSARATNEENYLAQKFTRVVLGTNNVDCCARVCHTPTAAAMKMMLGTGAMTNSFDDIEKARTILICGANPSENHPIPGARVKQAKLHGANLIVIDPRKTELARAADIHLQLRPGTNILMFNALAHVIIDEGLADAEFIETRVTEFEQFRKFVAEYSPEAVADECGVPAELIRRAARMYASATPSMSLHGLGMTEHYQGTEGVMTIVNLALLTGNFGKPGSGVNPLRGQNNVQGSAHMGCDPGILTGSIAIEAGRDLFEKVWQRPVPTKAGYNQLEMMDAGRDGKLKALWAIGYDVFMSNANAHETARSFENMDLVIVQDLFLNETAKRFGTVFFPACSSYEKDGTFMNGERRVQRIRKAVEPRGHSRNDLEIICDLAAAMGFAKDFDFWCAEDVWNEVREVWPPGYGMTYERLESKGLQWPCPTTDHPGTEVLHATSFSNGPTAALKRIKYRPTKETVTEDFPFLLTTGRVLEQFNAGTMTMRTPNKRLRPTDRLMMSPRDAVRMSFMPGERVRMRSRHGEAVLPVEVSDKMREGELFASFHDPSVMLNFATSPVRDRFTQACEFKVTAVDLEKLS